MHPRPAALVALVASAALLPVLTGCGSSLIPFTHELRTTHGLSNDDVKNLQFYTSHAITLRRELESGSRRVAGGRMLVVLGKTVEEVVVPSGTPGVAVEVGRESIAVSFEPGTSITFALTGGPGLPFGALGSSGAAASGSGGGFAQGPNPFPGNDTPPSREPEPFPGASGDGLGGRYWIAVDSGGKVPFQGGAFAALDETLKAHLVIDSEKLEQVVDERKELKGVRLPNR